MRILIRTDASLTIGTGHVMRCLTLADELRERGAQVEFVSRIHEGHLCDFMAERGYSVHRLPPPSTSPPPPGDLPHSPWLGVPWEQDAAEATSALEGGDGPWDWLIVDHYGLDERWEREMGRLAGRVMVIDDVADRRHDCHLLLDQNYHLHPEQRYRGLLPEHCTLLLGPEYALLRKEFREARRNLRNRDGSVARMLIFFGGVDPGNETAKALQALHALKPHEVAVDVVAGAANPHTKGLAAACAQLPNAAFHSRIGNMAELMAAADLAIGAGGVTMLERLALGLPSLVITIAKNQEPSTKDLATAGAIVNLGNSTQISAPHLLQSLQEWLDNPAGLKEMSAKALRLVDGEGAKRTADKLVGAAARDTQDC